MGIASWVLIGLLTGSIARVAMPGPAAGGMSVAILIGVIGALIGGIVGTIFSPDALAPFNLYACVRRSHRRDDTSVFVSLFRHPIRKTNNS